MPYSRQLYDSIDEVDVEEWRTVSRWSGNLYLDPRFLKAVEKSFSADSRFWYVVFRDDHGRVVAATCFTRYLVDLSLHTPKLVQNVAGKVRCFWSRFLKYRMLLCGIPVSTCDCQLAIAEDADLDAVLAGLDDTAMELARKSGCRLISFKEFPTKLASRLSGLSKYGFLTARSVFAYRLDSHFALFDDYLASRTSASRTNIRRSLRKFDEGGLTCQYLRGRDGFAELYTDEVHRLYLNVLGRAKVRFECVPREFFQELARQLPDESCFAIIRQGEKIVGFCSGLAGPDQHILLLLGYDDSISRDTDLYFNLIYRSLEQGLSPTVRIVHFGGAADDFKKRIGCVGEWRTIYVKATNPISQSLLKAVFPSVFDTRADSVSSSLEPGAD